MRIGELSQRTGVTQKAIRYYETRGLLNSQRTPSGYRDFDERAVAIVGTIRHGQQLGMRADDLREVIELLESDVAPCIEVRRLLSEKRAGVAKRISELQAFDTFLESLEREQGQLQAHQCSILQRASNGAEVTAPRKPLTGR